MDLYAELIKILKDKAFWDFVCSELDEEYLKEIELAGNDERIGMQTDIRHHQFCLTASRKQL